MAEPFETHGVQLADEPKGYTPSLEDRAFRLRDELRQNIEEVSARIANAEDALRSLKEQRVKAARLAVSLGMSKEEVAEASGVSTSTLGNWVRGDAEEKEPEPIRENSTLPSI